MLLGGLLFFLFFIYIKQLRNEVNVSFILDRKVSINALANSIKEQSLESEIVPASDLRYAISQMEVANQTLYFTWGAVHWNRIIDLFIPSQLVGNEFKEALKFNITKYNVRAYLGVETFKTGIMNTVLGESFKEFWLFGIVFIFLLFNFTKSIVRNTKKFEYTYFIVFVALITPSTVILTGSGTSLYIGNSFFFYIYLFPLRFIK